MREIHKPHSGQTVSIPAGETREAELTFKLSDVVLVRRGDDLVLEFADGAVLIFDEYFSHGASTASLKFADGITHLNGEDYLSDSSRGAEKAAETGGDVKDAAGSAAQGQNAHQTAGQNSGPHSEQAVGQSDPTSGQATTAAAQDSGQTDQADSRNADGGDRAHTALQMQETRLYEMGNLKLLGGYSSLGSLDMGDARSWHHDRKQTPEIFREHTNPLPASTPAAPAPDVSPWPAGALVAEGVLPGGNAFIPGVSLQRGSLGAPRQNAYWEAEAGSLPAGHSASSVDSTGNQTVETPYGLFALDTTTGKYTYTLDNGKTATQSLNAHESAVSTLSFVLRDAATHAVLHDADGNPLTTDCAITIVGANDRPDFTLVGSGVHSGLKDGGTAFVGGAFRVQDRDADGAWTSGTNNANHRYEIRAGEGTQGAASDGSWGEASSFRSEYGTLVVRPNGTYGYTLNSTSDKVHALTASSTHTDVFVLTAVDAHGAWSRQTISVEIGGKNDPPRFSIDTAGREVKEKGHLAKNMEENGTPHYSGTLVASHIDAGADGITYSIAPTVHINGASTTGTVIDPHTLKTAYGTLYLEPKPASNAEYPCEYRFVLDNDANAVNTMSNGQTVNLHFTVSAADAGGTRAQQLAFSVKGTNDKPEITSLGTPATLAEDAGLGQTTGQVTARDADTGDRLFYSIERSAESLVQIEEGKYGRLEITEGTGAYKYILNNGKAQELTEGQTAHDEFWIRAVDSLGAYDRQLLRINIQGKDDKPVLGNLSGSIREDMGDSGSLPGAQVVAHGTVTASDRDTLDISRSFSLLEATGTGNSVVQTTDGYAVEGRYGTLAFKTDGSYTYTLTRNQDNEIQKLAPEQSLTESFKIRVTTGQSTEPGAFRSSTEGQLVITIEGSNDAPVITAGDYSLDVNGNPGGNTVATGKMAITDVDQDQTVTTDAHGKITSGHHTFYFQNGDNKLQSLEGKYGTIKVDRTTGEYTYTLNEYAANLDIAHTENFTLVADDGRGGTATQDIAVRVAALTSPPVGPGTSYTLHGGAHNLKEDHFSATTNVQATGTATGGSATEPYGFKTSSDHFSLTTKGRYGSISIDKTTGEYTYTLDNSLSAVQQLAANASLTESFRLWGSGSGTVDITILGSNDRPEIHIGQTDLTVSQKDGEETSTAWGALSVRDPDMNDSHTFTLASDGSEKNVAHYRFTVDGSGKITGAEECAAGTADYRVEVKKDTGAYRLVYLTGGRHLTADDSASVSFSLYAQDSAGITAAGNGNELSLSEAAVATVSVKGNNAPPVWTAPPASNVTEDAVSGGSVTCTGTLNALVTDDTGAGAGDGLTFSIMNGNRQTMLLTHPDNWGTLLINDSRTGDYTFTLNNQLPRVQALGEGEIVTAVFTIRVTDKHGGQSDKELAITITGTNDNPVLASLSGLNVTAEANSADIVPSQTRQAKATDVDSDQGALQYECAFKSAIQNGTPLSGKQAEDYGTLHLEADGKYWFALDNSKEAVKALGGGETITLTFEMTARDDHGATSHPQSFAVQISGVNDAPEFIAADSHFDRTLDLTGGTTTTGKVTAIDPDSPFTYAIRKETVGEVTEGTTVDGNYGTITIGNGGNYTYTLRSGVNPADVPSNGREVFTVLATDANGAFAERQLTITLEGGTAPAITGRGRMASFAGAPDAGDSPVMAELLANGASLDSLLGAGSGSPPRQTAGTEQAQPPGGMQAAVVLPDTGMTDDVAARILMENQG